MTGPVRFQTKFLGRKLWSKQKQLCTAIANHRSVSVKGCHGSGKTYTVAGMVPYELLAHQESIVLTVAPTLRQVKLMWAEIETAIQALPVKVPERTTTGWEISEKCKAIGFSSSKGVNAQGFHGARVLIIADEAVGIAPDLWDAIEGIRAAGDVRLVKLCNPTVPAGAPYDDFTKLRAQTECITISAFDTPNLAGLTMESLLKLPDEELDYAPFPWLTRRRWVREMYHKWGPTNPRFMSRVLGEFPSQSQWSVFELAWIERAKREPTEIELQRSFGCVVQVGIDVAAGGEDETAAVARVNGIVIARAAWSVPDPPIASWLSKIRSNGRWQLGPVMMDIVGVGFHLARSIADQGFDVYGFKAGTVAMDAEQFMNAKAEAYFRLREMYKTNYVSHLENDVVSGLPVWDEDTAAQLSTVEYREMMNGKILIEPKEHARKRGVQSPDRAEAQIMAFQRVISRSEEYVIDANPPPSF